MFGESKFIITNEDIEIFKSFFLSFDENNYKKCSSIIRNSVNWQKLFDIYEIKEFIKYTFWGVALTANQEQEKNQESVINYCNVIANTTSLVNEMIANGDVIDKYLLLLLLINKGVFSKTNSFFYTTNNKLFIDVLDNEGIDIILGRGCCRHTTDFMTKTLTNLGYSCKKINVSSSFGKSITHVVPVVLTSSGYLAVESTGINIYIPSNNLTLTSRKTPTRYYIDLLQTIIDPSNFSCFNSYYIKDWLIRMGTFVNIQENSTSLKNRYQNIKRIIKANEPLIFDFQESINPYVRNIKKRS